MAILITVQGPETGQKHSLDNACTILGRQYDSTIYIKLAPGLADQVLLPYWKTDLEANLIQKTADLAVQFGYATAKPNMKQLLGS